MASTLVFPENRDPLHGWESSAIKRDDTSDERIVRELVQNALDAADGDETVEVEFHLASINVNDLPHIEDYRNAYSQAKQTLSKYPSMSGKQVTDRIDNVLETEKTDCLICVDNAKGLSGSAIQRLYSEGITDKPTQGRGSVGLGHLAAFAASDLRYVLYAGRYDETGVLSSSFGGHAILASQSYRDLNDQSGKQLSSNGFICDDQDETISGSEMIGTSEVPSLMENYLPINGTGSAVMLCGYSSLVTPPNNLDHADWLLSAVAKNFIVAILQGALNISFVASNSMKKCNEDNLKQTLEILKYQKRRTRHIAGPPGQIAYDVWQTLRDGQFIDHEHIGAVLEGVQVWVRELPPDASRSRVAIFREGMWITDECNMLKKNDFGDTVPFFAVVNLPTNAHPNSFTSLVREAEGTSHLEINLKNITNNTHQEKLKNFLTELQQKILEFVPTQNVERHIDDTHRLFDLPAEGKVSAKHTPVPKAKPTDLQDIKESEDTTDEENSDDEDPGGGGDGKGTKKKRTILDRKERPKKGNSAGIKTSAKRVDDRNIRIAWFASEHGFPIGAAGIRIAIPGGSDMTSRSAVLSKYLNLRCVEFNGNILVADDDTPKEVLYENPPVEGEAVVELAEDLPISDASIIFADIVHRRPTQIQ